MKKAKLTKIFVLILSLALLIGSSLSIISSAEEAAAPEYSYSVKSINISHGDRIQVLIAVDAPAGEDETITVKYDFLDATGIEAKYWKDMDLYENDDDTTMYPVYYTDGISAKDMGEVLTATVYKDGEVVSTADISVAKYLYTRLYKNGFIEASTEEDIEKKELYLNLLTYGANAQKVLWNNKAENADNQRTLVTDYTYVQATDANVSGLVAGTDAFEVTYTGSDKDFYGWNVTKYALDGTKSTEFISAKTLTVDPADGHIIATPASSTSISTFENIEVGQGYYSVGITGDDVNGWSETDWHEDYIGPNLTMTKAHLMPSIGAQIKVEEQDGDKVLHFQANGKNGMTSDSRSIGIGIHTKNEAENPNASVIDFDIYVNKANTDTGLFEGTLTDANGNKPTVALFHLMCDSSQIYVKDTNTGLSYYLGKVNTWVNVRLEYYLDSDNLRVYGNDVCVGIIELGRAEADRALLKTWGLFPASTVAVDAYLDNIYAANGVATEPTEVNYATFDGDITAVEYRKSGYDWVALNYNFEQNMYATYGSNATTYLIDSKFEILEDESGNKYLHHYSSKRGHMGSGNDDRDYQFFVPSAHVTTNEATNAQVFDFDIKMDSKVTLSDGSEHNAYSGSSVFTLGIGATTFTVAGDLWGLKTNGATFADYDKWNKVRIIYFASEGVAQVWSLREGNSDYVYRTSVTGLTAAKISGINFVLQNSGRYISVNFDNIAVYNANIEYVADPNAAQ